MRTALTNARVLIDGTFEAGKSVIIADGRIEALVTRGDEGPVDTTVDLVGDLLVPGFIDVQVNGGGGALFNAAPTVDTIRRIGTAHRAFGTTGFLPTLISDDLDKVSAAIAAVDQAMRDGVPGVLGIHIEGPFLSHAKNGIHDPSKFRALDPAAIDLLASLPRGRTLVTLAPEETTCALIRKLVGRGVIVAAGHTNASYEEMREALDAGVTGFTHLFNAMTPFTSRAPGVVGAALEDDNSWCGIIADGHHVHPASLRVACRAKGTDRMILVTDAMPSVGAADKSFRLGDFEITVEDGKCTGPDGSLAGSDLDMAGAVRNAMQMLNLDLADASLMASAAPAAFLGLDRETGRIAPGMRADLVALGPDVRVRNTWIGGDPSDPASG